MKKSLLSILFVFCLIIPCTLLFSACNLFKQDSTSTPSTTKKQKSVVDIEVEVNNSHFNKEKELFEYNYGEDIDLALSNFSVKLIYQDGSSSSLSDTSKLSLYLGLPSSIPVSANDKDDEYYHAIISYNKNISKTFNIKVISKNISVLALNEYLKTGFPYTGEEYNILEEIDKFQLKNNQPSITELLNNKDIEIFRTIGLKTTTSDAGEYSLALNCLNNSINFDGKKSCEISWSIAKAKIESPTVVNDEFTYDGSEKEVEIVWSDEFNSLLEKFNVANMEDVVEITNNTNIDAGSYTCVIELKGKLSNYTFDSKGITWTIDRKILTKPTLEGYVDNINGVYTYSFTGKNVNPEINASNEFLEIFDVIRPTDCKNSDTNYSILFRVKDGVNRKNYVFDDKKSVTNFSINYYINKANYSLPSDIDGKIILDVEYNYYLNFDNLHLIDVDEESVSHLKNEYFTEETVAYLTKNNMLEGENFGYYIKYDEELFSHILNAGDTYNIEIEYYPNRFNLEYLLIDAVLHIKKQAVALDYSWYPENHNFHPFYLNRPVTSVKLEKQELTYQDSKYKDIEFVVTYQDYFEQDGNYVEVSDCINAGNYKTYADISCDNNYFIYAKDDESKTPITQLYYEWHIDKQYFDYTEEWSGSAYLNYNEILDEETGLYVPEVKRMYLRVIGSPLTVDHVHYYKQNINDEYVEVSASELYKVGYYKTVATCSYDTSNYYYGYSDDLIYEKEWEIYLED